VSGVTGGGWPTPYGKWRALREGSAWLAQTAWAVYGVAGWDTRSSPPAEPAAAGEEVGVRAPPA